MSCETTFMGGPEDGKVRAFPSDEPPATVTLLSMGSVVGLRPNDPVPTVKFTYRRQVSQLDSGPLWIFVPA